jgi:hypothetical protein
MYSEPYGLAGKYNETITEIATQNNVKILHELKIFWLNLNDIIEKIKIAMKIKL